MSFTQEQQQDFNKIRELPSTKFLQIIIKETIDQSLDNFVKKIYQAKEELALYSVQQVCELFHVTSATVHNWKKRGWLVGRRVGKNRFYTRTEIDSAITRYQVGQRY